MRDAPSKQVVLDQLEVILASEGFASSPRSTELLRYIVTKTLDGDVERLRGYAIGLDVFGRDQSFDPMQDSIVRVQIVRLRKLLKLFYASASAPQKILIQIPKGQYQANFQFADSDGAEGQALGIGTNTAEQNSRELSNASGPRDTSPINKLRFRSWIFVGMAIFAAAAIALVVWQSTGKSQSTSPVVDRPPQIALMPIEPVPDSDGKRIGNELRNALAMSLTQQKLFPVIVMSDEHDWHVHPERSSADSRPMMHIHGNIQRHNGMLSARMALYRTDGEVLLRSANWEVAQNGPGAEKQLSTMIAREMHLHVIEAVRLMLKDNASAWTKPWFLYLNANWNPGEAEGSLKWELERVEFARKALTIDPGFLPAHAVLADKLAYLANVDTRLAGNGARRDASAHVEIALAQGSDDPNITGNIANYFWHMGELEYSAKMAQQAVKLDPDNPIAAFQEKINAYSCASVPNDVLRYAEQVDSSLPSDSQMHWFTLTSLNQMYLNNGDLEKAVSAGRRSFVYYRPPEAMMRHATTLVAIGELAEAQRVVEYIAPSWPGLNLHEYARSTVVRRCGHQDQAKRIVAMYQTMATQICARIPRSKVCQNPNVIESSR